MQIQQLQKLDAIQKEFVCLHKMGDQIKNSVVIKMLLQ